MTIAGQPAHLLQQGVPSASKLLRRELTPPLWEMGAVMGRLGGDTGSAGSTYTEPARPGLEPDLSSYTSLGATSLGLPGGAGGFPIIATGTQLFSGLRRRSLGLAVIEFTNAEPQGITADLRYPRGVNQIRNCYSVDSIPHFNMPVGMPTGKTWLTPTSIIED